MSLRFDRFLVDDAGRRLLRDGSDVHLTPKAFELLLLLIEKRPAAVSKAAILESLWPGTYVLEANVANLVAEVRAALDDDSSRPRFVRTVPRFGYAFSGDLAGAAQRASGPAEALTTTTFSLVGPRGRLALPEGATVLGREGVAAELLNSPLVSRRHARLDVDGSRVFLEDLGSKNGCTVDGQRIAGRVALEPGARIGVGPIVVTLVREDSAATQTYYGRDLHGS